MTANELADWCDEASQEYGNKPLVQVATMLRQQQAELNAFKLQYYNTGYSLQLRDKDETIRQQQAEIEALKKEAALQRLSDFTQEAEKTLTDEEIKQVMSKFYSYNPRLLEFARAILRKAQEK